MSVKLTVRQVGDVSVVDAVGRLTLGEGSSLFRDTIRGLVAQGNKKIVLNLGEVSYIDSSGIGELVSAFTTVTNQGGKLKLLNLTKRVHDLLQITKLYTVFDVYDREATAIASFA
ncbi:MAG: STAS domain-containing protein [Acidobacteriales bacterium]|nr:STAS domain-containing protein [Terriglobales bacterium]